MKKSQLLKSLKANGFSKQILEAFEKTPREKFIPESLVLEAYEDTAQPIGHGQTISQPYTIATMLELLQIEKDQKVLEIGSGCGYVLALLSNIVGEKGRVYGVEIVKELYEKSRENIKDHEDIMVYNRQGTKGLSEKAPFDRILISAALEEIPNSLVNQLKSDGLIVAPIGKRYEQSLVVFKKNKSKLSVIKKIPGFIFVPFITD
ncbi:MAG: protein-L-isoaspartate O-methyltransferase [Candidatus Nanoarchaeia archaeon]